jgi:hypothetical protein
MLLALFVLAGCDGTYAIKGSLEDGIFSGPMGGFDIIATATDQDAVTLSCKKRSGKVADDGTFSIDGMCKGSAYTLSSPADVLLPDFEIPDGGPPSALSGKAYRSPGGDGLYFITPKDGVQPTSSNASIKRDIRPDQSEVIYPNREVLKPPLLAGDAVMIATGEMASVPVRRLVMQPEGVDLASGRLPPCYIIGDDATVDMSNVTEVTANDQTVRYYRDGALPEGRYALYGDSNQRMLVFDVGSQQPAGPPAAPAAP